jgi:hypothetical protein
MTTAPLTPQSYFTHRNRTLLDSRGFGSKADFGWVQAQGLSDWHFQKKGKPLFHVWSKGSQFFVASVEGNGKPMASITGLHKLNHFLYDIEAEAGAWDEVH